MVTIIEIYSVKPRERHGRGSGQRAEDWGEEGGAEGGEGLGRAAADLSGSSRGAASKYTGAPILFVHPV
jgi:hypothetical protein